MMPYYVSKKRPKTILESIKKAVYESAPCYDLGKSLDSNVQATEIARVSGSLAAFVLSYIVEEKEHPLLIVVPNVRIAEKARDDLRSLLGEEQAMLLPPRAAIPYDPLRQNLHFDERAGVFERLVIGELDVIITTPSAIVEKYESIDVQKTRMVQFKVGDEIDREILAVILSDAGMKREIRAEEPGQFALRGGVVDVFPPAAENPVRLELFGDEIVEIRSYDPSTQRSQKQIDEIHFFSGEQTQADKNTGIWDLVGKNTLLYLEDQDAILQEIERVWEEIEYQYDKRKKLEIDRETQKPNSLYFEKGEIIRAFSEKKRIIHRGVAAPTVGAINFEARSHDSFLGDLDRLVHNIRQYHIEKLDSIILCDKDTQVDRLDDLLEHHGVGARFVRTGVGSIHEGFTFPAGNIVVLTDHQIFGRHKRTSPFRKRARRKALAEFEHLKIGDFVVHTEYGIGKYLGLKTITVSGSERECVQLEYREGVKVYVRLEQFSRLQKFQGTEGAPPKLSKIGGTDWSTARKKTQKAVEELAQEIIELYARRTVEGGFQFSADTNWQREMEAAFEFEDTPDQVTAVEEIKRDMEKNVAMDRLLCGDVGFGKTEVAIRAAFKALQDSKQVAVLVPTTILAQQHYATFVERLRKYPLRIETMSRFRSRLELKKTAEGLANGDVDMVIGTHRILSKDINFKNLGLMIIDEEHRFGVKQKDKLKQMRATVDVLTLSATPIPRTLNMALSGAKDMSLISTPPHDRQPIETEVSPFDEHVIREAILREIARGGQVYFLHNRVQSIMAIKRMIERLLPDIKVGVAHGQMKERELEHVMEDFLHQKHDVLVCTMIIESGLDIPNVNTLIVNRADRLGLAQLYQVRGRIGRSHRKAYAYLLTPPRMVLTREARQRLETIAEHTRLGSGFQIAMRDLEIRGAGNLLGPQQSGSINAVGFELYTEMLSEAVKKLSETTATELPDVKDGMDPRTVKVDVAVDAMLPVTYVVEPTERVELYRRLSRVNNIEEVSELRAELRDRYGVLPETAEHLVNIVEVQVLAAEADITRVELYEDATFITFKKEWGGDDFGTKVGILMKRLDRQPIEFRGAEQLSLKLSLEGCETWHSRWQRALKALREMKLESLLEEEE
ncbi:transcription-repair coupling factor [bacterium]|nr:transcription-repair coupling factor [bacterium]